MVYSGEQEERSHSPPNATQHSVSFRVDCPSAFSPLITLPGASQKRLISLRIDRIAFNSFWGGGERERERDR